MFNGNDQQSYELDEVEGEKDFDKAYGKLVHKYYGEQGISDIVPEEDLYRLNEQKVNIKQLQSRI